MLTIYYLATDVGRFVRKTLYPPLIASLKDIRPSREELESALSTVKQHGGRIGKKIKANHLYEALLHAGMPQR